MISRRLHAVLIADACSAGRRRRGATTLAAMHSRPLAGLGAARRQAVSRLISISRSRLDMFFFAGRRAQQPASSRRAIRAAKPVRDRRRRVIRQRARLHEALMSPRSVHIKCCRYASFIVGACRRLEAAASVSVCIDAYAHGAIASRMLIRRRLQFPVESRPSLSRAHV